MEKEELQKIEIYLPLSYCKDKNKVLWWSIRYLRDILINREDIKWDLQHFWDETPMSTTEIRNTLLLSSHNFSHHLKSFKKWIKEKEGIDIKPFISWGNGPDIYLRSDIRKFISYMNRNSNKYNIEL